MFSNALVLSFGFTYTILDYISKTHVLGFPLLAPMRLSDNLGNSSHSPTW